MAINTVDLRAPNRTLHVGVILPGGETEILDVAPIDYLSALTHRFIKDVPDELFSAEQKKEAIDVEFHYVTEKGEPARMTAGMRLMATDTFANCPRLDVVLMGATMFGYKFTDAEAAFIRKAYEECDHFLTICGGVIALLEVGLLTGKTCTAPRDMIPMLQKDASFVNWTDKRWEQDGKLWTSGALLNGTDMMRAWAEQNICNGPDSLASVALRTGGWPVRDRYYRDDKVPAKNQIAA